MTDLVKLARQRIDDGQRTHYEGCERDHRECLIQRMADEIERLQAECLRLNHAEAEAMSVVLSQEGQIERLRQEVEDAGEALRLERQDNHRG
jgi:short-subunit dehydrogenase